MLLRAVITSKLLAGLLLVMMSACTAAFAQQEDADLTSDSSAVADQDAAADTSAPEMHVVNLATGKGLPKEFSPLRWGNFSILSVDTLGAYNTGEIGTGGQNLSAAAIRTLLDYNVHSRRFNIDFQYMPSVWFSEGEYSTNFSSQASTLSTTMRISPRWTMHVSNDVGYYPDRGKLGDVTFTADFVTDNTTRNPYLSTGLKIFSESVGTAFSYAASERDTVTLGMHYEYFRLFDIQSAQGYIADYQGSRRHGITGSIGWSRKLDARSVFGLEYAEENRLYTDSDTTTHTHTVLASYARDLKPGLRISVAAGPTVFYGYLPGTNVGYRGAATVSKQLAMNDTAAFSFVRDSSFNGITSDARSNRYDLTYSHWIKRVARATFIFSDTQESYSKDRGTFSGWSVGVEGSFNITRQWQLYAIYNNLHESNPSAQIGPRSLVACGLRWVWSPRR